MECTAGAPAFAGVDTHKETNMLALKDGLGRTVGIWEFPANPAGYDALADAIGDTSVPVGVEGARSYGAGLAQRLAELGYEVREVVRPRREQRRRGKTDEIDALAACDNLAAGRSMPAKEMEGGAAALRWLMVAREQEVAHMTRLACCMDSMLVTAPYGVRERWRGLEGAALMRAVAAGRPKDAAGRTMREVAKSWLGAEARAGRLEAEILELMARSYPALIGAPCVGAISGARIVLAAGSNPSRLGGEAAFSMLCGTSPVPASSGNTVRHRLNRGGNRQANRAVHEIARARMSHDPRTKAYIARKMSEGKTKREAVRCLCRYIAREIYRLLTGPQEPPCDQSALAERRKACGLTQRQAAEGAGITRAKVGGLERLAEFDTESLLRYDAFLREVEAEKGLDSI
ncbi:Transposase IS116/IS110/IS902 family [Slackia heliotrinireducens]|uniref:Transposase n=1 Tax=Slackia heliotrinireducens (strain ATCC 29202 / DSM 20476 / NCTC 11029 / RHS 1) TaxID=471855 RepID=C7N2W3_SLAHD|nr:IS110 family transposase [Slackia heliotrinireducens]ACV21484.1 transposase [Slackia heliotrinireducens DSM 20476]VEG98923.1 Transposase IS116/IS110/IS902 family [Slackia heliotrinireducens]